MPVSGRSVVTKKCLGSWSLIFVFLNYGYPMGIILGNARPLQLRSRLTKGMMLKGLSISLSKMLSYPIQL